MKPDLEHDASITILPTTCQNCGHALDPDDYCCDLCGVSRGDKIYICPKCNGNFIDYADLVAPVLCYECRAIDHPEHP